MLLPKGKLDLKLSLEKARNNLGLSIAVFQRTGRMKIFMPARVVRAHDTTFGTLKVHYVSFSHLILQIMDWKHLPGNHSCPPVLKEEVGEDVKDESKAGSKLRKRLC